MRFLIVGLGISGTWLSYWLYKAGADFHVIDHPDPNAASRVASGVINPVTGRQIVTTWMAEELMAFSKEHYEAIGSLLGKTLINRTGLLSYPSSDQMKVSYEKKIGEDSLFIHPVQNDDYYCQFFRVKHGVVKIDPAYLVDVSVLLASWRQFLLSKNLLSEEIFDTDKLVVQNDGIEYNHHKANKLIRCDGPACFKDPVWEKLPYALNKGEALIADIPDLPADQIYKFGLTTLVPYNEGTWWIGSTYENDFEDAGPTSGFRKRTEHFLNLTLQIPFRILDHIAGIRPATIERRPFIGQHPFKPALCIFNGMGSKGVSLAPFYGKQLADFLIEGRPLDPEVDILRFKRAFL